MTVAKAIIGLCIGLALFSVLQTAGIHALQDSIRSNTNAGLPNFNAPVVTGFDADALRNGILPKYGPIDTSEGQRLAVEGVARRIDLETRNALSHVPLPRR
ncbi:MAG TPA: hypothetical protein VEH78_05050 [Pseudolabrys sp.]|nr:hypothetical protein [Pseudolabrys sp.]